MRISVFSVIALAVVVLATPSQASASTLATTTAALSPWQGSNNFNIPAVLDATVEYAVFAPGAGFQNFLNENAIVFADPAPSEYTYAYQFTSITQAPAGISTFTVGLQNDEAVGISGVTSIPAATDYGTYPLPPSNDPFNTGGGPGVSTSSQWSYFGLLGVGGTSGILFYSSPEAPEFGFAVLASGTTFDTNALSLPNPAVIPEPTTAVLFACGLVLLAGRRSRYTCV